MPITVQMILAAVVGTIAFVGYIRITKREV